MTLEELLKEKREEIIEAAAKHGAQNVRVFGSALHGETGPESDIDLLIEVGETTTPWFPSGLVLELEELLGCKVDILTEQAIHWSIRDEIVRTAVPL